MTLARREEILSKDILGVQDVMELNNMSYGNAAKLVREIRRVMPSALTTRGKVTTQAYLEYFKPRKKKAEPVEVVEKKPVKSQSKPAEIPLFRYKG